MELILDKKSGGWDVFYNDHNIGDFCMDVDGFYKWWPEGGCGYMDQGFLRTICTKLEELNAEWEKQIARDIGGE